MKKYIIILLAGAMLLSSCYVSKGLPCPCMHCMKGKTNYHINATAQKSHGK